MDEKTYQVKQQKLQESAEKRDRTLNWVRSHNSQVVSPQLAAELNKAWHKALETNKKESEAICKEFDPSFNDNFHGCV